MDSMEDSGFDSDQLTMNNHSETKDLNQEVDTSSDNVKDTSTNSLLSSSKKSSQLQKKLEKHKENAVKKAKVINQQPHASKNTYILPRSRLTVPMKQDSKPGTQDHQPLVAIMTDSEDDDDFETPLSSRNTRKQITQQLMKDGYNLDLEPDDEDLDLIPPRPLNERCVCCQSYVDACQIQ